MSIHLENGTLIPGNIPPDPSYIFKTIASHGYEALTPLLTRLTPFLPGSQRQPQRSDSQLLALVLKC